MGFGSNPSFLDTRQWRSGGLQGLEAIHRTLNTTKDKIVKRATKAGINAGLVPLVRAMRVAVNASGAPPEVKRQARKTLAKRLRKWRGETIGKAGFGVGRQTKVKRERAAARSSSARRGVGISSANVHWFVLGTEDRETKRGKPTGRIDELLKGVTTMAAGTAGPAMVEAARRKIQEVMAREVAKIAKKGK